VTRHWFSRIHSEDKLEEIREKTPYYEKRLQKPFQFLEIRNGYFNDVPCLLFKFHAPLVIPDGTHTDLRASGPCYVFDVAKRLEKYTRHYPKKTVLVSDSSEWRGITFNEDGGS